MNNNQSTQQSSQLSKQEAPKPSRRQFKLLANHPWLLLVVVGALSVAISSLAISSLFSVGRVDNSVQTRANPQQTTQFSQPKQNKSTNWLLAIVLVGAGAGAVVIYRRRKGLAMPNFSWHTARNSWHTAKSRLTRRQQRKLLLQQSKTNAFTVEPQLVVESPLNSEVVTNSLSLPITDVVANDNNSSSDLEPEVLILSLEDLVVDDRNLPTETEVIEASLDTTETVVTILPPEDEEISDFEMRSLAEMMDIRKHLSISAILQDFHPKRKAP